jgi:coenzyme F420-0:L-glutamate ligase/coenzyme F420-1:gamma-L-glutamate ligase
LANSLTEPLILTAIPQIPLIQPGDNLGLIIHQAVNEADIKPSDGDIFVIAQKIVSKSEGRLVNLASVNPSCRAVELAGVTSKDPRLVELILQESSEILRTRLGMIIVEHRLGFVCANAGIDHSNVKGEETNGEEWVLLLPKDPDDSATKIRQVLEAAFKVRLGVMIIDSHGRAWRMGTTGVAIGLAGLPGLVDLRGISDLFGYVLQVTQVGVADELAAAASLVMGQAAEATPVVHVRGFPYPLRESHLTELLRPREMDLFR